MKTLRSFIKESINDMLTFKDGRLEDSSKVLPVSDRDKITAMKIFAQSDLSDFSYKYHYVSSEYPEGVLVTCKHSRKTYLVSHGNPGRVIRYNE